MARSRQDNEDRAARIEASVRHSQELIQRSLYARQRAADTLGQFQTLFEDLREAIHNAEAHAPFSSSRQRLNER